MPQCPIAGDATEGRDDNCRVTQLNREESNKYKRLNITQKLPEISHAIYCRSLVNKADQKYVQKK